MIGEADPPLRAEVARRVCAALGWHLAATRVGEDFAGRYGERLVLLETLVETPRFRGTCYRAANWRYLGETAGRVLFLTLLGRECPAMPCDVVFDTAEWHVVTIVTARKPPPDTPPTLDQIVRMVASLGGFLGRQSNGFPGPQTLWIGLQRAADFVLAMEAQRGVGEGDMVNSQTLTLLASVIDTWRQRRHSPWLYLASAIAERRSGRPLPPLPQPGV